MGFIINKLLSKRTQFPKLSLVCIAGVLTIIVGAVSVRNANIWNEQLEKKTDFYHFLGHFETAWKHYFKAEKEHSAYLITQEERYLQSYERSTKGVRENIERTKSYPFSSPDQRRRLEVIERMFIKRVLQLNHAITERKHGLLKSNKNSVLVDEGWEFQKRFEAIRELIEREEVAHYGDEKKKAEAQFESGMAAIKGALALILICLSVLWFCLLGEHRQRKKRGNKTALYLAS